MPPTPAPKPPGESEIGRRAIGAVVALASGSLLGVSTYLTPASEGHGTHIQLGMPPCGWVLAFGKPCPTCGMTTSFAHAAEGELIQSALVQPAALLLAVLAAGLFWGGAYTVATGSRLLSEAANLLNPRTLTFGAILLASAWVYKIATWTS